MCLLARSKTREGGIGPAGTHAPARTRAPAHAPARTRTHLLHELADVALVEADGGAAGEDHDLHAQLERVRQRQVRHVPGMIILYYIILLYI